MTEKINGKFKYDDPDGRFKVLGMNEEVVETVGNNFTEMNKAMKNYKVEGDVIIHEPDESGVSTVEFKKEGKTNAK